MSTTICKFDLLARVRIRVSGEAGEVIGRAEYATTNLPSYLLRYRCADGRAVEAWWTEDALELVEPDADAAAGQLPEAQAALALPVFVAGKA